jgi:hypothetical protein
MVAHKRRDRRGRVMDCDGRERFVDAARAPADRKRACVHRLARAKTVVTRGKSTTVSVAALEDVLLACLRRGVPGVLEVVLREAVTVEGVDQLDGRSDSSWRRSAPDSFRGRLAHVVSVGGKAKLALRVRSGQGGSWRAAWGRAQPLKRRLCDARPPQVT